MQHAVLLRIRRSMPGCTRKLSALAVTLHPACSPSPSPDGTGARVIQSSVARVFVRFLNEASTIELSFSVRATYDNRTAQRLRAFKTHPGAFQGRDLPNRLGITYTPLAACILDYEKT